MKKIICFKKREFERKFDRIIKAWSFQASQSMALPSQGPFQR